MRKNNYLENDFFEKKRYPALRVIATIMISLAIIVGLVCVLAFFEYLINHSKFSTEEWWISPAILLLGSVVILVLISLSELIKVFLDIEQNTRTALMSVMLEKEKLKNKDVVENRVDPAPVGKVLIELSLKVSDSEKVEQLNSLIAGQKGNLLGAGNKVKIIELTTELCENKEYAECVLLYYKRKFNKDLLNDLKSLTTNYSGIKDYLRRFIELGIVKEEYPHDKI